MINRNNDVVTAEHIFKAYQRVQTAEIRDVFQRAGRAIRQSVAPRKPTGVAPRYVLNDVNFTLRENESVGLIGNNGTGKTTLLRLIAGVMLPTKGHLRVRGRVSSLIALGAGFHQDLTGRENLLLNCALMGLNKNQTGSRMDQIVDFSELGAYIDEPIRRYSSGMLARLGFSVAVFLDPELILVDEVLAVGDYNFQVKCAAALRDFIDSGTVILVSHDMDAIKRICKRAIWLEKGHVRMDGPSTEVISQYISEAKREMDVANAQTDARGRDGKAPIRTVRQAYDPEITIGYIEVLDDAGNPATEFTVFDSIRIRAHLCFNQPKHDTKVLIGIADTQTYAVLTACDSQLADQPGELMGDVVVEARFPNIGLRPRDFGVVVELTNSKALMPLLTYRDLDARFTVNGPKVDSARHFMAPQADLMFTPGVSMRFVEMRTGK